jgi:hypothetical protein
LDQKIDKYYKKIEYRALSFINELKDFISIFADFFNENEIDMISNIDNRVDVHINSRRVRHMVYNLIESIAYLNLHKADKNLKVTLLNRFEDNNFVLSLEFENLLLSENMEKIDAHFDIVESSFKELDINFSKNIKSDMLILKVLIKK